MRKISTIYKNIFYLIALLRRINWIKWVKARNNEKAEIILWIQQEWYSKPLKDKLLGANLLHDLSLFKALSDSRCSFKLVIGPQIGPVVGKHIIYSISDQFNLFRLPNHTYTLHQTIQYLEELGNKLYPPYREVLFWENKAHMHKEFERLQIPTPKTKVINNISDVGSEINFPALIKETHSSGSLGIIKVDSLEKLIKVVEEKEAKGKNEFLLQELLPIRRDLRVTLVAGKIVHYYWRINTEKDWKPTSTGWGSKVDFIFFPERWRQEIENTFTKLGLVTGAFDIAWYNDDLETQPMFLEVSPQYMPNPPINKNDAAKMTYAQYKKSAFPIPHYALNYISLVFELKKSVVDKYLSMMKK
jgi:hypothetical protein